MNKKDEKVEAIAMFCYHINKVKQVVDVIDTMPLSSERDFIAIGVKLGECEYHFERIGKIGETLTRLAP